ncbi:hypothetical protein [Streptomyces parvulus]|uniref:Uncharacterized protein n=1 Tax=Streptomyces parvulus TaxID=146923 RepID=A0A191UWM8_9ACTN|nr:hypothetical protein [Streptomyces parvulus]ANJ07151.1 hypothetical protein Spa2297_09125 [Streptomyces parvulus]GGR74382.1 hypothetical protein GCM10010220_28360 [Streptomyces parvulus]
MTTPIDFGHDTARAQAAVKVAERRKLPVPQAIYDTAGMWQVVMDAAHARVPDKPGRDDVPATAEELAALIEERAHQHRIAAALRYVSADFKEPISSRYNQLVREHVPGWIAGLQTDFLALTKKLTAQEKKLPANLDRERLDWRDPKVTGPWEMAESAAIALDQLVADRQIMARAANQDLGRDADLWAVAKLAKEPDNDAVFGHQLRDHVGPAIREVKELRHQPVSRWLYLARSPHLELSLAAPREVKQRQQVMDRWHDAVQIVMGSGLSHQQAKQAVTTALQG